MKKNRGGWDRGRIAKTIPPDHPLSVQNTLVKARARKAREREFKKAKPLTEQQIKEMVDAHMAVHGAIVCNPAFAAPSSATKSPFGVVQPKRLKE